MSNWNGEERRKNVQDHRNPIIVCKQEDSIKVIEKAALKTESLITALDLRINGTLEKMTTHVADSTYWRRFIMGVAISLVMSMLGGAIALFSLSYNLGLYTKQILINTTRIDLIEEVHRRQVDLKIQDQ